MTRVLYQSFIFQFLQRFSFCVTRKLHSTFLSFISNPIDPTRTPPHKYWHARRDQKRPVKERPKNLICRNRGEEVLLCVSAVARWKRRREWRSHLHNRREEVDALNGINDELVKRRDNIEWVTMIWARTSNINDAARFLLVMRNICKRNGISSYSKNFRTTYPRRAPQYQPNAAQDDDTDKHEAELPRKWCKVFRFDLTLGIKAGEKIRQHIRDKIRVRRWRRRATGRE